MMEHGWELSDSVQDEQGLPTQRVGMERSQEEGPAVVWAGGGSVLTGTGGEVGQGLCRLGWEAVPAVLDGALSLAWRRWTLHGSHRLEAGASSGPSCLWPVTAPVMGALQAVAQCV